MKTKNFFSTLLLTAMIFVPAHVGAQVTIGSATPPRATLDVVAADENTHAGIIVPNVTRERLYNTTYTADQTGAIVYVVYPLDGTAYGQTVNVTEPGLYFFDGELWHPMDTNTIGWQLGGNNVTDTNNIFGTTNTQPIRFVVNSADNEVMRIATNGRVGIGMLSPIVTRLHISGNSNVTSSIGLEQTNTESTTFPTIRLASAGISGTLGDIRWGRDITAIGSFAGSATVLRGTELDNGGGTMTFFVRGTGAGAQAAERMRINELGHVGIGTDSPIHRFHISGAGHTASSITMEQSDVGAAPLGYPVLRVVNRSTNAQILGDISFGRTNTMLTAQSNAYIRAMTADNDESGILYFGTRSGGVNAARLLISSEGNVGIGMMNPTHRLHVNGNIHAIGNVTWSSDARFKRNIQTISNPLAIVNQLRGTTYEFRTNEFPDKNFNDGRQFGVIAQEIEQVLPELIFDAGDGYKAVNYIGLIPVLLQAINELSAKVNTQQQEIDVLRRQINN